MPLTPTELLDFLEKKAPQPLSGRDIASHFELDPAERKIVYKLLKDLVSEGVLVSLKGGRFSIPRRINLVIGNVSAHRDGYGFVRSQSDPDREVFIPARFMRGVMNGDRVVARVESRGRGDKPEGRILRVLEHAHQTLVGRFEAGERFGYVVPADPRIGQDVFVPRAADGNAGAGQMVIVRIDSYPAQTRNPEGTVIEVLGNPDDPEVEIRTLIHKYGLPYQFSTAVLKEARAVPETLAEEEIRGRVDLRDLPLVTIDGESARDFDDAVALRKEDGGKFRLWVAIADVSHYVTEGSVLDREAYERGTSVYFPDRAVPMLPEALSNGICSLNPGVDRLAMTAELLFDASGRRLEQRFYPAVIRSHARLTYTQVRDIVVHGDAETIERFSAVIPQLRDMADSAEILSASRRERGSLDFDLPEPEIILDLRGKPENIIRAERNLAHRMIEEFMLAANEAVAKFLSDRKLPFLYRIHEPPELEKLENFREFISHFNLGLVIDRRGVDARELQRLLAEIAGRPEERVINHVLLRSMKQARYAPENEGHFGLAADYYCHFTSPIRRYPDLLVHRVLRSALQLEQSGKRWKDSQALVGMGEQTSMKERRAMEAEREMIDLKRCQFMAEKVGLEFEGFVAGVQPFGFFVELEEVFVEGLVHISSLTDDFYHYEEDLHRLIGMNRRRIVQIGDRVQVWVENVKVDRREIDLVLVDMVQRPAPVKERRRRKRR